MLSLVSSHTLREKRTMNSRHSHSAAVMLAYFDYQNARWVQVWISSAMTCRLAVPLGVNESSCLELHYIPHNKPTLLPPSDDPFERESRRRVFWWVHSRF